ncbi:MAG: hypothetical protein ACLQDQ_18900 [Myxococcaceae bacterium]
MTAVPSGAWDSVFRHPTREQRPDARLRARAGALCEAATRLDAVYRLRMELVSRARAEEAALLGDVLDALRPALPALARPLLLMDSSAPGRPKLLHLRALLLFGETPKPRAPSSPKPLEGLFLLEDAAFLRVGFSGETVPAGCGGRAFAAQCLEAVEVRRVLRDHALEDVASVLHAAITAETGQRRAQASDAAALLARLQALRVLLRAR